MEEETSDIVETPRTPEEEALWLATEAKREAESTAVFGPPPLRARKNARYISRLVRKHGEQAIRDMLKALSTLDSPFCASRLASLDLCSTPLAEIIQPFEVYGLNFHVDSFSGRQFTVKMGAAYGTCGSGGTFVLERLEDGSFRVGEPLRQWIA